jgi:hypothetical protein
MITMQMIIARVTAGLALMTCAGLAACANDPASAPLPPLADIVWQLRVSPHGITLAQGETQQLTPTPINIEQQPIVLDSANQIHYVSEDTQHVKISPTGLITGAQTTSAPVRILATLFQNNVLRSDTVYVSVTPTRRAVKSVSVQGLDSTKTSFFFPLILTSTAIDSSDNPISGIYVYWSVNSVNGSSTVDPLTGVFQSAETGGKTVWVYGSGTAYGVNFIDSVLVTMLNPASGFISIDAGITSGSNGAQMLLQPCATVYFFNTSQDTVQVLFDDPSKAGVCTPGDATGNILLPPSGFEMRRFPNIGTTQWSVVRPSDPNTVFISGSIITK